MAGPLNRIALQERSDFIPIQLATRHTTFYSYLIVILRIFQKIKRKKYSLMIYYNIEICKKSNINFFKLSERKPTFTLMYT